MSDVVLNDGSVLRKYFDTRMGSRSSTSYLAHCRRT